MEYECAQWRQRTDTSGIQHARRFGKWLDYVTVVYINHWAVRVAELEQY